MPGIQLIGAKGGRIVEVDEDGHLSTSTVSLTDMEHHNEEDGTAWSMPFDVIDPTSADDYFVYLQNTSDNLALHVRRIHISSTVVGFVEVQRVTGGVGNGTDVTLVNFNQGFSSKTPTGTFQTSVAFTGLVDGGKYAFQQLAVADTTYVITFHHDIILDKNGAIALNWVPSTGILTGTVYFFTKDPTKA